MVGVVICFILNNFPLAMISAGCTVQSFNIAQGTC